MTAAHYAIEQLAVLLSNANDQIAELRAALSEAAGRILELEANE